MVNHTRRHLRASQLADVLDPFELKEALHRETIPVEYVHRAEGNLSIIDMHYLIAEQDKPVKHFVDTHELGLFETDETLPIMKETGLKARFLKNGLLRDRAIFVGVKPR